MVVDVQFKALNLVQILCTVPIASHTHLTETRSFAWYLAAALKPLPQLALVHTNNGIIVALFLLTKTNPKAPRYLSY